jgi:predicted nuclease with TOPRIM domain
VEINCDTPNCPEKYRRKEKQYHIDNQCNFIQIECEDCKMHLTREEYKNHSRKECASYIIQIYTEMIKSNKSYYQEILNSKEDEIKKLKKRINFLETHIEKKNLQLSGTDLWKNHLNLTGHTGVECVTQIK